MANNKQDKILNVPNKRGQRQTRLNVPALRFPEFEGEWKKSNLGNIVKVIKNRVSSETVDIDKYISTENILPNFGGIANSVGKPEKINITAFNPNDILLANIRPYLRKIWLSTFYGGCNADVFVFRPQGINPQFLYYSVANDRFCKYVMNGAKGVKMPRGDKQQMLKFELSVPVVAEQKKIVSLLSRLDARIATQRKIIEDLEQLKSAIRKRIFSELLLEYEPNKQIKDVLSYEQPTKYIVSDTEYSNDTTLTPVLTANKAFVLGYTEETDGVYRKGKCIILDDFTLDCKIVDFPFKVKSSAIKILTAKSDISIRYVYEYIKYMELYTSEHKRHYITEIEPIEIVIPSRKEMDNIARLFDALDKRYEAAIHLLQLYQIEKQYMLRQMFI